MYYDNFESSRKKKRLKGRGGAARIGLKGHGNGLKTIDADDDDTGIATLLSF